MRVNQVANLLQITPDTVRYYTRIGYLSPLKEKYNNYHYYGEKEVKRLKFILSARSLGFSVEEIGLLVKQASRGESPCPLARSLISKHLEEAERKYLEAQELRDRMLKIIEEWKCESNQEPTGDTICHLIENCSQSLGDTAKTSQSGDYEEQ